MKVWGQPTKGRSKDHLVIGTARRTRELLNSRGWCLWRCSTLHDEVIVVVRDEHVQGVPNAYPVYTEAELNELCRDDVSEATLRMIHEAKKLAKAKVLSGEEDRTPLEDLSWLEADF